MNEIIEKAIRMFRIEGKIDVAALAVAEGLELRAISDGNIPDAVIEYNEVEDKYVIKANINQPSKRMRFSIAHELAHFILHRSLIQTQKIVTRSITNHINPKEEREANILASNILMPDELVHGFCEQYGITPGDAIPPEVINKLAGLFEVSKQAMAIRIEQLGYVMPLAYVI